MRWLSPTVDNSQTQALAAALPDLKLNVPPRVLPVLADLLVRRGITEPAAAARFLTPSLDHLHDPLQMSGMKVALDRLDAAVERKEKILIYGDYDVDGTTAIVILKTAIELCGGTADFHVPHRVREGYGMRDEVIERAASEGVRLIISVDTGIRAFAAADTARRTGVDLIVTDHHLPGLDGRSAGVGRRQSQSGGMRLSLQAFMRSGRRFQTCARIDAAPSRRERSIAAADVVHEGRCHRDDCRRCASPRRKSGLCQAWSRRPAAPRQSRTKGAARSREARRWPRTHLDRSRLPHRPARERRRPHGRGARRG